MLNQFIEIIDKSNFKYVFRDNHRSVWEEVLSALTYLPLDYTNLTIDYQLEYQRGHGGTWHDVSIIIMNDGAPVAVWPLSYSTKDGLSQITSHGREVLPPIFVTSCSFRSRKRITIECLEFAHRVAREFGIGTWNSSEPFSDEIGLSAWHLASMRQGGTCFVQHELYVNLNMKLEDIKYRFRKRYKSLITAGQRLWTVDVMSQPGNQKTWQEFRDLHLAVAGRVTRSEATWTLQHDAIHKGQAFLVTLRDCHDRLVGGGLFGFSRDEGGYGVGAYDRTLFDKPLGHAVQFRAIQEMQKRGIRWYNIGIRYFDTTRPKPTEKEISISHFKEGFATHVFPTYNIVHNSGNCN